MTGLTYIKIISKFLKLVSLTPVLIFIYLTPKWLTSMWYFDLLIGSLNNAAFSYFLKGIIKSKRPGVKIRSSYGMPSSHSAFVGYIWAFLLLEEINGSIESVQVNSRIAVTSWGLLVCYSRYYFGHHNLLQLLVGLMVGACIAYLWILVKIS